MENLLSFNPAGDVAKNILDAVTLADGCSCGCDGGCGLGQGTSGGKTTTLINC
jgi:hypothetical protein